MWLATKGNEKDEKIISMWTKTNFRIIKFEQTTKWFNLLSKD